MTNIDLLQHYGSYGSRSLPTHRTDFHIYIWPIDTITFSPLDQAGYNYYASKGMGFVADIYDISGAGAYVEATLRSQVDLYWNGVPSHQLVVDNMDLWYVDTETTFYTGLAADASTDLTGAQNAVSWFNGQWATHTGNTPPPLGNYGNSTGIRTKGIIQYPYNFTPSTFSTLKNDNDVNGLAVANTWKWMGPELYKTQIDSWIPGLDWLCNEKARIGTTTPLIPLLWRHAAPSLLSTYNLITASLEYAYTRSECNGIVLWGVETPAAGPTYFDGAPWMQAALDFTAKYSITRGTPF